MSDLDIARALNEVAHSLNNIANAIKASSEEVAVAIQTSATSTFDIVDGLQSIAKAINTFPVPE